MADTYPKIIGEQGALEQQPERVKRLDLGWTTVRKFEGSRTAIEAVAAELDAEGSAELRLVSDGTTGTLTASYPDATSAGFGAGTLNVTWELVPDKNEKDIKVNSHIRGGSAADLVLADYALANGAKKPDGTDLDPVTDLDDQAQDYYVLRCKGQSAWPIYTYRIRKTIKVGTGSDVKAALSGVNRVGVIDGAPSAFFDIPTTDGDGDLEWLKCAPSVIYLGKGKYSIVQEWVGGRFSALLFGGSEAP